MTKNSFHVDFKTLVFVESGVSLQERSCRSQATESQIQSKTSEGKCKVERIMKQKPVKRAIYFLLSSGSRNHGMQLEFDRSDQFYK